MKYRRILVVGTLLILSSLATFPTSAPTTVASCIYDCWSIVPSPNFNGVDNRLFAVTVISTNDAWAVHWYNDVGSEKTLTIHWNGSNWSIVPSPNPGARLNRLWAVTAVASNDVWAVGEYSDGGLSIAHTLTLHWDGAQWSHIPSPDPGTVETNTLRGVAALSATNVWAVGHYNIASGPFRTVTMRWNGNEWEIISSPSPGMAYNYLMGVVAIPENNEVWAVGQFSHIGTPIINAQTLTVRWTGNTWVHVPSPNVGTDASMLQGVTKISGVTPTLWAVGRYYVSDLSSRTLALFWNGSEWTSVPSPHAGISSELYAVAPVAANHVWAVGYYNTGSKFQTLIIRWNGAQWSITPSPNAGASDNYLFGVAVAPSPGCADRHSWAVGYYLNSDGRWRTLVERYTIKSPCDG